MSQETTGFDGVWVYRDPDGRNLLKLEIGSTGNSITAVMTAPEQMRFGPNGTIVPPDPLAFTSNTYSSLNAVGNTLKFASGATVTLSDPAHAALAFDPRIQPVPLIRLPDGDRAEMAKSVPSDNPAKDTDKSPYQTIHQLFVEDQADRETPGGDTSKLDWAKIGSRDEARRKRVRGMLESEELNMGIDFREASFIFQHGSRPDDFLLAHILAMAAVAKGDQESRWIAAATLDRYLNEIGQPQVFGTQYHNSPNEPSTQQPFDHTLIPTRLRTVFCVLNDHIQQIMLDAVQHNRQPDLSKYESELPCKP